MPHESRHLSGFDTIAHGLGCHLMAVSEQTSELSVYEPACKKLPYRAEGELISNAVSQDASAGALWFHLMSVIPTSKRARNLDVSKLPSFDVIAVLEHPPNSEWAHMDPQNSAIAVMDSRCPLYDFNGLPGWC